jgi:hypothetical protein
VIQVINNNILNNNVVTIITINKHADQIILLVVSALEDVEVPVEIYIEAEHKVMPVLVVS